MQDKLKIGTRKSELAMWQTNHVADLLRSAYPSIEIEILPFSTRGDEIMDKALPSIGGKGVFTEALEKALRDSSIDYAVHSLKDLPTDDAEGLTVGAVTARAHPADALVSKGGLALDDLPIGAIIGTSSRRRAAQLLAYRDDLRLMDIRGNVGTRIKKALADDSPYDATVLACAGLERLGLNHHIAQILPLNLMLPAPGQGALAIQCRHETQSIDTLSPLKHLETLLAVTAERAFLSALGGGCSLPVAAYAIVREGFMELRGRVCAMNGDRIIDVAGHIATDTGQALENARMLGAQLAQEANTQGAKHILAEIRE